MINDATRESPRIFLASWPAFGPAGQPKSPSLKAHHKPPQGHIHVGLGFPKKSIIAQPLFNTKFTHFTILYTSVPGLLARLYTVAWQ